MSNYFLFLLGWRVAEWKKSRGQNMFHAEKNPVSERIQKEL